MHTKTLHLEDLGDYIGTESCVDLKADMDETKVPIYHHLGGRGGGGRKRREKRQNAFPPPIPWLARTKNVPSHMPWVLKRYCTGDGRLIVREEMVRHQEYFRAHRANGRLTLHLIPLDDNVLNAGEEEEEEEEQVIQKQEKMESLVCFDKNGEDLGKKGDSDDSMNKGINISPEDNILVKDCVSVRVIGGGGGGGGEKWCKFDGVRLSPCMYGMPVPAIRPVHI